MRGLGRNVKFMTEYCFQLLIKSYLLLLFIWVIFGKMKDGIGPFIREEAPFFICWLSVTLVIVCAMSYSDMHFKTMVSQGSARKPAAWGMLLSQYIFLVVQFAFLVGTTFFSQSNISLAIKKYPLVIITVLFILQGWGILCATLAISEHSAWAAILFIGIIVACVAAGVLLGIKNDFVWNAELLEPYNNLWLPAIGLAIEIIGACFYLKTAQKVDLKLV